MQICLINSHIISDSVTSHSVASLAGQQLVVLSLHNYCSLIITRERSLIPDFLDTEWYLSLGWRIMGIARAIKGPSNAEQRNHQVPSGQRMQTHWNLFFIGTPEWLFLERFDLSLITQRAMCVGGREEVERLKLFPRDPQIFNTSHPL